MSNAARRELAPVLHLLIIRRIPVHRALDAPSQIVADAASVFLLEFASLDELLLHARVTRGVEHQFALVTRRLADGEGQVADGSPFARTHVDEVSVTLGDEV